MTFNKKFMSKKCTDFQQFFSHYVLFTEKIPEKSPAERTMWNFVGVVGKNAFRIPKSPRNNKITQFMS